MQAGASSNEESSSGSSSSSAQPQTQPQPHPLAEPEQLPQAGPLPAKVPRLVGEIGYTEHVREAVSNNENPSTEDLNAAEVDALNGRHPADRSYVDLPSQSGQPAPASTDPTVQQQPATTTTTTTTTPNASTSTLNTIKPPKPESFFRRKYGGVTYKTIIRFCTLLVLLMGCIVGWVFAGIHLGRKSSGSSGSTTPVSINPIFVHMIFAVITIVLLVFVERGLFRVRAERYAHKHPGQVLPSHHQRTRRRPGNADAIAFAPWNRPPLPTYAAALGFRGTGDVEDAIIAAPPPPAYGNTRGSTLLLVNLIRNSVTGIRSSHRSSRSSWHHVELDRRSSTRSAPVPYDESEMTEDARRAQRLADTLAQLEDSRGRNA